MKIAVMQNKWDSDIERGLQHVVDKVVELLKNESIDFLLLPEFFIGPAWFQPGQIGLKGLTDDTIPGRFTDIFSSLARQYHVNIIMGTIVERCGEQNYNTSVYIDRDGNIVKKVSKMHTFAGETKNCAAAETIDVIDSDLGMIGIAVCSDFWIMEHMKILTLKGARIIFIPGGTLGQNTDMMIQALKTISYLTATVVVYASAVGKITGMRGDIEVSMDYIGSSIIVTPDNQCIIGKVNEEDVLVMELDDYSIDKFREESLCWKRLVASEQECYTEILNDYIGKE